MTIILENFTLEIIRESPVILITGKKFCGKSVLVADLLNYMKIPKIFCSLSESDYILNTGVKGNLEILEKFTRKILDNILENQKKVISETKKHTPEKLPEKEIAIVLDMSYMNIMIKWGSLREIFFNGKILKIALILTSEYYTYNLPPEIKSNIDYVFIFRSTIYHFIRNIHHQFFDYDGFTVNDLKCTLNSTKNYQFVILNRYIFGNIRDSISWYQADCKKWIEYNIKLNILISGILGKYLSGEIMKFFIQKK